jgi:hypothetical protein
MEEELELLVKNGGQEKGEEEAGFIGRRLFVPVGVTNRD